MSSSSVQATEKGKLGKEKEVQEAPTCEGRKRRRTGPTSRVPIDLDEEPPARRYQSVQRNPEGDSQADWGIYYEEAPEEIDMTLHPSGIVPTIQNVVATFSLGHSVNLKNLVLKAKNAEYNPKRFSACIIRIKNPQTTALVFSSGKVVVTGAKTENLNRLASKIHANAIRKIEGGGTFQDWKVQNIVASCDVKFTIQMETLDTHLQGYSFYEPEIFPGLVFHSKKPKCAFLIFISGKVVVTGAKFREDMYKAFEDLYPVLQDHRKL